MQFSFRFVKRSATDLIEYSQGFVIIIVESLNIFNFLNIGARGKKMHFKRFARFELVLRMSLTLSKPEIDTKNYNKRVNPLLNMK